MSQGHRQLLERNQRAARLALERGWLDTVRIDALTKLGEAWGQDLVEGALQASWLSQAQARELHGALGSEGTSPVAPPPSGIPLPGARVGDYVIERHLGSGAMGTVFEARHQRAGLRHALKLVELGGRPEEHTARFLREGEALGRLRHPGVVRIHSCEILPGGLGVLAMDLVKGESLEDRLGSGPLPIQAALKLGAQLARALEALHEAGIVHRDLKPANVIVRADTHMPVLCDFGVVHDLTRATRLTHSGQLLGSPLYMAPEQILGERAAIGPATDIFSLGVILYQLVSGQPPFDAESIVELAGHILEERPTPLRSIRPEISRAFAGRIARALAKRPSERPSAAELADDLERLSRGERIEAPLRLSALALGLGCVLLLSGALALFTGKSPPPLERASSPADLEPGAATGRNAQELLSAELSLNRDPTLIYSLSQDVATWLATNPGDSARGSVLALGQRLEPQFPLRLARLVQGDSRPGGFLDSEVVVFPEPTRSARWSLTNPPRELGSGPAPSGRSPLLPCGPDALLTVIDARLWRWTESEGWTRIDSPAGVDTLLYASPRWGIFVSAGEQQERVLRLSQGGEQQETLVHENRVRCLTVLSSGVIVTGVQSTGRMKYAGLRVWKAGEVANRAHLPFPPQTLDAAGPWLAVGDERGHLFLIEDPEGLDALRPPVEAALRGPDIPQPQLIRTALASAHAEAISKVRFLRGGERLLSFSSRGGELAIWNARERTLVRRLALPARHLAVSPDGDWGLATGPAVTELWALQPPAQAAGSPVPARSAPATSGERALADVLAGRPYDEAALDEDDRAWARFEGERRKLDAQIGTSLEPLLFYQVANQRSDKALELVSRVDALPPRAKLAQPVRGRLGETCLDVMLDLPHDLEKTETVARLRKLVISLLPEDDPRPDFAVRARSLYGILRLDPQANPVRNLPDLERYGPRWKTLGLGALLVQEGSPPRTRLQTIALEDGRFAPLRAGLRGHVEISICLSAARRLAVAYETQLYLDLNTRPPPSPRVLRERWSRLLNVARTILTLVQKAPWLANQAAFSERLLLARVWLCAGQAKRALKHLQGIPSNDERKEVLNLLTVEALILEEKFDEADPLLPRLSLRNRPGAKTAVALGLGDEERARAAAMTGSLQSSRPTLGWRSREASQRLLAGEPDARQPLWDALKAERARR